MCAYLGITKAQLEQDAPYVRVLAFNQRGRETLKIARTTGDYFNIGQSVDSWYQELEDRAGSLYGLFAKNTTEPADSERRIRIYSY